MASIFTKIIRGEIPCHRVYEDDEHFAFLDIQPVQTGHTLVIPKRETGYLFDLPPAELAKLWTTAQRVANVLKAETGCARIVTCVVGYEVPHAHVHLIPTNEARDFPLPARVPFDAAAGAALAARLRAQL